MTYIDIGIGALLAVLVLALFCEFIDQREQRQRWEDQSNDWPIPLSNDRLGCRLFVGEAYPIERVAELSRLPLVDLIRAVEEGIRLGDVTFNSADQTITVLR